MILSALFTHAIEIAKLIAIPAIYIIGVLYFLKFTIGDKSVRINCVCFVFLLALPIAWLLAGYISFRIECNSSTGPSIYRTAESVPGIFTKPYRIYGSTITTSGRSKAPSYLVKNGTYRCLERSDRYYSTVVTKEGSKRMANKELNMNLPLCSEFAFEITTPKSASYLGWPYHKVSTILISNRFTGEVLASADEQLFGGGLVASYRKYLGGISTNPFSACGYLEIAYSYNDPHKWRGDPMLTEKYLKADIKFITSTLTPLKAMP